MNGKTKEKPAIQPSIFAACSFVSVKARCTYSAGKTSQGRKTARNPLNSLGGVRKTIGRGKRANASPALTTTANEVRHG